MKKFITLVKLLFSQQFKANASADNKKRGGTIVAFVILGICFAPMLVGIAVTMFALGQLAGADQGIVAMLILFCQSLVLLLGLPSLISGVFMPKDADKLLYLPIKPSTIFSAKLTVAYLNEVITTAVTILFLLIPYGLGANVGVGYYLMLVPALLLIPLLPILIGTIVAMPIAILLSKIGKNGLGKTLVTVLFFVMCMALYMLIMIGLTKLESTSPDGELTTEQLLVLIQGVIDQLSAKMVYVHTNYVLAGSLVATDFVGWIVNFLLTLIEFAVLGTLTILVGKPFYRYMIANQIESGGSSGKKAKLTYNAKPTSVLKQLIVTDLKRTLRDSQLGFQSFAGIVLMPLLVIVFGISINTDLGEGVYIFADPIYQLIAPVACVAYFTLLGCCINVLGLYSITRENKSFYVLKTLPISFNKILVAKVILSTLLMVVVSLLTTIVTVIAMHVTWYYAIGMMIVLTLVGFGSQCITTHIDLKDPKFGWSNFQQSLKNSKNTWIATLIGFIAMLVIGLIAGGFIALYIVTQWQFSAVLMWIVLTLASGLFAFVAYKVMANNSQKLFDSIEA